MMIHIRHVQPKDLSQLLIIENLCFSPQEAATQQAFIDRIQYIADSFFVAELNNQIIGLINGPVIVQPFITDDLFSMIQTNPQSGGHQSILGLTVHPNYRNKGIASALLKRLEEEASSKKRFTVTLTCHSNLIPFYEALGYQNFGIAQSTHAGTKWYNLVKTL